jgi:hypothetical protein
VIGYDGLLDVDTALADAALLGTVDARAPQTGKLMGGRWVLKSSRDWQLLIDVSRDLGAPELATMFETHRASLAQPR